MKFSLNKATLYFRAAAAFLLAGIILFMASNAAFAIDIPAKTQSQTGVTVFTNGKATIDASNTAEGYIMIKYTGGKDIKIKVQIIKSGGETYSYDLNNDGRFESFPISQGNGSYTIGVYENISGSKYATAHTAAVSVTLRHNFLPFLYSNQFVNYDAAPNTRAKATELISGKSTDMEKLQAVYYYVIQNFTYDNDLATAVTNGLTGYLPNLDSVLASKKGICFDYAALMAGMLRSQNIPCQLVVGYAGTVYHAWINVYISNVGWVDQAVYFDGQNWSLMDPTFASSGGNSAEIQQYIGTGSNYSTKYVY